MSTALIKRDWLSTSVASVFSLGIAATLLGIMLLSQGQKVVKTEPKLEVRSLAVVEPPPPPPQVTEKIKTIESIVLPSVSMSRQSSRVQLELSPLDVDLNLDFKQKIEFDSAVTFSEDIDVEVTQALKTHFSFSELAQKPRVLNASSIRFSYPKELFRVGLKEGKVELLIEINPKGRAKVISVVSSDHPKLTRIAKKVMSQAIYDPPKVDGRPVTARDIWPITLKP